MTLDSILNVIVPALIFIFLAMLIYSKAKKPIDTFFAMVKGWFKQEDGDEGGGERTSEPLDYKIEYRQT